MRTACETNKTALSDWNRCNPSRLVNGHVVTFISKSDEATKRNEGNSVNVVNGV